MKYMLMMNTMRAGQTMPGWQPEDFQAHIAFMRQFSKDLRASGELLVSEGLSFPQQAVLVRAGEDGRPVTDENFPEGKEFLAGFWIVDVASQERAIEIAAKVSAAPGPGGKPLNMAMEVRPIQSGPPPKLP